MYCCNAYCVLCDLLITTVCTLFLYRACAYMCCELAYCVYSLRRSVTRLRVCCSEFLLCCANVMHCPQVANNYDLMDLLRRMAQKHGLRFNHVSVVALQGTASLK